MNEHVRMLLLIQGEEDEQIINSYRRLDAAGSTVGNVGIPGVGAGISTDGGLGLAARNGTGREA
jgi:hypothetical protein